MSAETVQIDVERVEVHSHANLPMIDIHTHFMPPSLPDFSTRYGYSGFFSLEREENQGKLMDGRKTITSVPVVLWNLEVRSQHMRTLGINTQVLSPLPCMFNYWAKADDTDDLCRIVNNSMAKEIQNFTVNDTLPGTLPKFFGLGIVPMQAPELAIVELERCVNQLGFKGIAIGTHVNEWNLDATELIPFWERCEELQCCVIIHPSDAALSRRDRKYWLPELIGMPHETNRAIATVVMGGVLEKFPKLKLCFTEGGGSYPYLHGRFQQAYELKPDACAKACDISPEKFLGKFFCDTVVGNSTSLELLVDVIGEDKVMFGSNYPLIPGSFPVSDLEKTTTESGSEMMNSARNINSNNRSKITTLNALEFLGLDQTEVTEKESK